MKKNKNKTEDWVGNYNTHWLDVYVDVFPSSHALLPTLRPSSQTMDPDQDRSGPDPGELSL